MRVLFITNIPSPYRVDFFNEFGKHCKLTVCYERRSAGDRDTRWHSDDAVNYVAHFTFARQIGTDKSIGFDLIREIRTVPFDHLIITGYASPSVMLAIAYCRLHRIPYFIESDGGFFHTDHGAKRILKKFLLCGAKGHFTTCEEHISYLTGLGISKDKIHKYPFTSLKERDISLAPASCEEKAMLRAELGIIEQNIVLSVGQFIPRKGFDVLLDAAKSFPPDTGTYIVGGTPGMEYIAQKEKLDLQHVHFVDFMQKEELKKWYRSADVFVLPTREDVWGLVINEAMAQGLPVITTDRCIAGLELVQDNENGFIIPVEDSEKLHNAILTLLVNYEKRNAFGMQSLKRIEKYTIENMAKKHIIEWTSCGGN